MNVFPPIRACWFVLLLLSWAGAAMAQTATLQTVVETGPRSKRINIVFLSEGYTTADLPGFAADTQTVLNYMFSQEPWNRYQSSCNVYRIEIASTQSGTDNGTAGEQRDTFFDSGFRNPKIAQLLVVSGTGISRATSLLNTHVPEYDVPVVLVNDNKYGGSGGPISVISTNFFTGELFCHEVGHSFAGLTDEYDEEYPGFPPTEFANATTNTNPATIRWKDWLTPGLAIPTPELNLLHTNDVGAYEGANYRQSGWYRPHNNALMRTLTNPPGAVAREAFVLKFYQKKLTPAQSFSPASLTQTIASKMPLSFSVSPLQLSTPPALSVKWSVNGVVQAGVTGNTFDIASQNLGNGTHKIMVEVADTAWVKRDPSSLATDKITWTLNLSNQVNTPELVTPLGNLVKALGDSVEFDATTTEPGPPYSFQWLKNNKPVPGATQPKLALNNLGLADAASYAVRISGGASPVTFSAVLAVVDPSPQTALSAVGKTATLALVASSNLPAAVVWNKNGLVQDGGRISGASTRSLVIKQVAGADAGAYAWSVGGVVGGPFTLGVLTSKPDYPAGFSLPDAFIGANYQQTVPAPPNLDTRPTTFSAAGLPPGMKVDAKTGVISGRPTAVSKDPLGYLVKFTLGNDLGKTTVQTRLMVRALAPGVAGVFNGLVDPGSGLGGEQGGRVDLTVTSSAGFSGKLVLGAESLPFSGALTVDPAGSVPPSGTFLVKPKAGPPGGVQVAFDVDAAASLITGKKSGDASPSFAAWGMAPATAKTRGYYTFGLRLKAADEGRADVPQGVGTGSFTVAADGRLTATGKMADGEGFTTSCYASSFGEVLLFQLLYTTTPKGFVAGVMTLVPGAAPDGSDTRVEGVDAVDWRRPPGAATARLYKAGFGPLKLTATGGRYVPPGKTELVLWLPLPGNARLDFTELLGEDLTAVNADLDVQVKVGGGVLLPPAANNPKKVTLVLTPTTGVFKGTYTTVDSAPGQAKPVTRTVAYQGMLLNDGGVKRGLGWFLRPALPTVSPPTTPTTSPLHSGKVIFSAGP